MPVIQGNSKWHSACTRSIRQNENDVKDREGGLMKNKLVVRSRNVLKRNALRFAAALLAALASFVAAPNAALTQAPQDHDQVPGFYRQKVGDLEVTALFDGHGVFDLHWLNGTKATMDAVVEALHEDPRLLDVSDEGFLVNTGKQLILVDVGAGTWWGGGALGRLLGSLRSAGYTPEEVDIVLVTHLHSDHVGGLTTHDGKRVCPNADVYVAKAESDFWLSPEIATKAPKDAQPFFQSAQTIAAPYIKAGKWHTFSGSEPIIDGMQLIPLSGHTPGLLGSVVAKLRPDYGHQLATPVDRFRLATVYACGYFDSIRGIRLREACRRRRGLTSDWSGRR